MVLIEQNLISYKDKEKGTDIKKPTKKIMELNIRYNIEEGDTPC